MRSIIGFLCFLSLSSWSIASQNEFIKIYKGRELYVEYDKASPGQPTIVLLNGMTYSTKQWSKFIEQFKIKNPGVGILTYDMYGMGKTLLKYSSDFVVFNVAQATGRVHFEEQSHELSLLLKKLKIQNDIHLVGLSYGGGIAQFFLKEFAKNSGVKSAFLLAPFLEPLKSQVDYIETQIHWVRIFQPYNQWSDEQLYDYFLRVLVYSTYPLAEPIVLENPYKLEATYRLAQGMKNFDGLNYVEELPGHSIHMLVPLEDEYIQQSTYSSYWDELPESKRASRLLISGGRHKLPEELPGLTAEWISKVIRDKSGQFLKGDTFRSEDIKLLDGEGKL